MSIKEEFKNWFEKQVSLGLVDFKIDISDSLDSDVVMEDILSAEKAIATGNLLSFPKPLGKVSEKVKALFA